MPNGTIPSWEEWNEQLTKEQREYSLYKILQSVDSRLNKYDADIKVLKNRKTADKGYAMGAGLVGGFIAVLTKSIW